MDPTGTCAVEYAAQQDRRAVLRVLLPKWKPPGGSTDTWNVERAVGELGGIKAAGEETELADERGLEEEVCPEG